MNKRKLSTETKNKISISRKKYLRENPDKHPWKRNSKFKSIPCETLKDELVKHNIVFLSEYEPSDNRFYSIDIAFPNKKVGVEINGNQHYNGDGTLKQYYQKRHDYLLGIGWNIIEIHYSIVYNHKQLDDLVNNVKSLSLNNIEYEIYSKEYFKRIDSRKPRCSKCGVDICRGSIRCKDCNSINRINNPKRTNKPTKEELKELIDKHTWTYVSVLFNVSDSAIIKWAKQYGIYNGKQKHNSL